MKIRKLLISLSVALCAVAMMVVAPVQARGDSASLEAPADASWFKLPTEAYKGKQDDVFFLDQKLGFYVNGAGKIFRSEDGGSTWKLVLSQPGTYFRAIGMVDSTNGFAGNIGTEYFPGVTDTNPLYSTHDGGTSWQVVKGLPGAPVKGICAIDVLKTHFINAGKLQSRTIIHAAGRVGGPAYLLRSLDGGASWTNIDMNPYVAMIVDVKFFDEMNGFVFAGSDANIERSHALIVATHDGGKTWKKVYESSRPYEMTWKGYFPSRLVGFATVQNYNEDKTVSQRVVTRTIDGGKTWTELPLVDDHDVNEFGVGFANEQLGWVGTSKSGFETRDGGKTWRPVEMGRYVNKIRIVPDGRQFTAFAIGANVYKFAAHAGDGKAEKEVVPISVEKP